MFRLSRIHYLQEVIKHMAEVCLHCQIVHKEWVQCLSGEMVANWPSWLSAIRGHGALDNKCAPHNSGNSAALPAPRLWFRLTRIVLDVLLTKKTHLQWFYLASCKVCLLSSQTEWVTAAFHHSLIMANSNLCFALQPNYFMLCAGSFGNANNQEI